jgi:hypothetical protein
MDGAPHGIGDRLPKADLARLDIRRRIVDAINGNDGSDGETLRAAPMFTAPTDARWLVFETAYGQSLLSPLVVDGLAVSPITMDAGEGLQAADLLDRLDTLICRLETLIAATFEPVGLTQESAAAESLIRLEMADHEGRMTHRADWAPPPGFDCQAVLAKSGAIPSVLARAGVICAISVPGPALPPGRTAALRPGDVLLVPALSARVCTVTVHAPPPVGTVGGCRLRRHESARTPSTNKDGMTGMDDGENPDVADGPVSAPAWAELAPPLKIVIDHAPLPLEAVARLAPGAALPLSLDGGHFPVRILAGDTEVAAGELVAFGEGYGVLIRTVAKAADAA